MNRTSRRGIALAVLLAGLTPWVTLALPGFSDRNIDAGNLNSADRIKVQEIRITRSSGETVTLASITVQNLGTADDGEIDQIIIEDGSTELGSSTNIAGLPTGVTINLGGFNMTSTTHDLKIFVVVGTAVSGGETVNLRCKVHYVRNGLSYSSAWISDLTGETIRLGGFDEIDDSSPDGGFMNPNDADVVQRTVFTDNDANGRPVEWAGAGTTEIVRVENLGTAEKTNDVLNVKVTVTVGGTDYHWDSDGSKANGIQDWGPWNPASPMGFQYDDFWDGTLGDDTVTNNPPQIGDNGTLAVQVEMRIAAEGVVTDGRTIRTKTTVRVQEQGQDSPDPAVRYDQTSTSESIQTIRNQGFERIGEASETLASGTAATGDEVVQTIEAADDDRNTFGLSTTQIYLRNMGTADGDEIDKVVVKRGTTTLLTLDNTDDPDVIQDLLDFRTGRWYVLAVADTVANNGEPIYKIYYTIGTPDEGHTLRPAVRLRALEPAVGGTLYASDEVIYPDAIGLYEPGFEFVENATPPEGGTAYSGQRLLAQTVRVEDRDEDDDDVTIHPIVVKNIGTASGNPDVVKIEIWRRDTEAGTPLKLGETTDLAGFRTGGARIDLTHDNVVQDADGGTVAWIDVYLLIAEPEVMVAGKTIQLETRVLHTEKLASFDKMASSNQWILETNHRPVPDFTFAKATAAAATVGPKADYTYEDTIQFTGTATDPDGDAISSWRWNFGDGNTSSAQNPTHQYPNGGTFNVTLTVTDARGVTGSKTKPITVEGPPNEPATIDELTADPTNPAVGEDVEFGTTVTDPDQPAGTAFGYEWDFGDETTSTAASPTHSYDEAGVYTVTLTVTDARGATDTATIEITVGNEPPAVGGLTADPANPGTGDEVGFTATGVTDPDDDEIDHYEWDFGDGATANSDGLTVTHIFAAPGTYTVSVVAVDARGARSAARSVNVTVTGPARTVLFAFPNPAATVATFTYFLPTGATDPILRIYSLIGELILEQELPAGGTTFGWDLDTAGGAALPNGLYFCVVTVTGANPSEVFRLLIVR